MSDPLSQLRDWLENGEAPPLAWVVEWCPDRRFEKVWAACNDARLLRWLDERDSPDVTNWEGIREYAVARASDAFADAITGRTSLALAQTRAAIWMACGVIADCMMVSVMKAMGCPDITLAQLIAKHRKVAA